MKIYKNDRQNSIPLKEARQISLKEIFYEINSLSAINQQEDAFLGLISDKKEELQIKKRSADSFLINIPRSKTIHKLIIKQSTNKDLQKIINLFYDNGEIPKLIYQLQGPSPSEEKEEGHLANIIGSFSFGILSLIILILGIFKQNLSTISFGAILLILTGFLYWQITSSSIKFWRTIDKIQYFFYPTKATRILFLILIVIFLLYLSYNPKTSRIETSDLPLIFFIVTIFVIREKFFPPGKKKK